MFQLSKNLTIKLKADNHPSLENSSLGYYADSVSHPRPPQIIYKIFMIFHTFLVLFCRQLHAVVVQYSLTKGIP